MYSSKAQPSEFPGATATGSDAPVLFFFLRQRALQTHLHCEGCEGPGLAIMSLIKPSTGRSQRKFGVIWDRHGPFTFWKRLVAYVCDHFPKQHLPVYRALSWHPHPRRCAHRLRFVENRAWPALRQHRMFNRLNRPSSPVPQPGHC